MSTPIDIYADNPYCSLEYKIAVMKANLSNPGWVVQTRIGSSNYWNNLTVTPVWDWNNQKYRIHPQHKPKKVVPLEASDLPAVCWVRWTKCPEHHYMVHTIYEKSFQISTTHIIYPLADVVTGMEYSTDRFNWKPMSKEV